MHQRPIASIGRSEPHLLPGALVPCRALPAIPTSCNLAGGRSSPHESRTGVRTAGCRASREVMLRAIRNACLGGRARVPGGPRRTRRRHPRTGSSTQAVNRTAPVARRRTACAKGRSKRISKWASSSTRAARAAMTVAVAAAVSVPPLVEHEHRAVEHPAQLQLRRRNARERLRVVERGSAAREGACTPHSVPFVPACST